METFATRNVGDVIAEILMSRTAYGGSLLLVEGETDIKFWRPRIDSKTCQFVLTGGKHTVTNSVIRSEELGQAGVLGIVDDDFDSLLNRSIPSSNIISTETCDMETLMLSSPAFDKLLFELGNIQKLHAFEDKEGQNIKQAFIGRALIFGQLRYLSLRHDWLVSFEKLSPYRFGDREDWSFNKKDLLLEFVKQVDGLRIEILEEKLGGLIIDNPWSILHGKDSLRVLAIGIYNTIGKQQISEDSLLQMLRLAFDNLLFEATKLYQKAKSWEKKNPSYQIFQV